MVSATESSILTAVNNAPRFMLRLHRWCWCLLLASLAAPTTAADSLEWRKDRDSVDADLNSWSLVRTLEAIAESTDWQIYLEPGTRKTVSTKFRDRPRDKALDLILGSLGRVLLPGTNGGPPRLLVFRSTEKEATRLIRATNRRGPKPIPNELIVTMKRGRSLDDLAKKLGAKIVGRSEALNSGRLQFESETAANAAREALITEEDVNAVDPNFPVISQPVPESAAAAPLPDLKLAPLKDGDGIVIGLVDTAVQHQGGTVDKFLLPGISVAGESTPPSDHPIHGTPMAETLLRSASTVDNRSEGSRVRILPVDVYGSSPTTTTYEVAEGIVRAMQQGASIINLSLGSEGDSPYLHDIIRTGSQAGRVFVASAGNSPVDTATFPAAYPEVIAVTAGDANGNIASYANRGAFVDVMAPGTSLINFQGQTWQVSGTSPAAAFISGAIAGQADATGQSPVKAALAVQKSFPPPKRN